MGIDLWDQAATFLGAALMGMGVGLVYDLFRTLRRRVRLPLLGPALDLLFWLLVTAGIFLYAVAFGGGRVRIYMVIALFLGAVAYFLALSPPALLLAGLLADALAALWRLATLPLRLFNTLGKKMKKAAKNYFHYRREWYKMSLTPGEMEDLTRRSAGGGEGAHGDPNQKGRHSYKDRRIFSPDLFIRPLAGHSKSNKRNVQRSRKYSRRGCGDEAKGR